MTEDLKNKILYSNLITELILTNKILYIYLGGSRLLGLETSSSDYDIIIIAKDDSLYNYRRTKLEIGDYHIHIEIISIEAVLNMIKYPEDTHGFRASLTLYDLLILPKECFIYENRCFKHFNNTILKYKEELIYLALFQKLNSLYHKIFTPFLTYHKAHYHFLATYYMIENLKENNLVTLKDSQKAYLKNMKENKILSATFINIYNNFNKSKYLIPKYDYTNIAKELTTHERLYPY